ncbi:hypothetical protein [Clostridium chauvoei]|uniref:hypothetical protein n=1 Tax=Clostridium chauvoei TaxID=46867 RepID=UPI0021A558F7|nr:hypothetical protein [Clostridium chauvoei]
MKKANIRESQLRMLDILIEIDRVCKKTQYKVLVRVRNFIRSIETWRVYSMG